VAVFLPGRLYFALESQVWTGGLGLYDPLDPGEMPARAYLVTVGQFSDIVAQEMYEAPGGDLDLGGVLAHGRDVRGPGRYETLVCCGELDGFPVITFTAGWRSGDVAWRAPSGAYLRHLASGLIEAHGWSVARTARYLGSRPGAVGVWSTAAVRAVIEGVAGRGRPSSVRTVDGP